MGSELTLKELRKKRNVLESIMLESIKSFEEETTTLVEKIDLSRFRNDGNGKIQLKIDVKVKF